MTWSTRYWFIIISLGAVMLGAYISFEIGLQRGMAVAPPQQGDTEQLKAEISRLGKENALHRERYDRVWSELAEARRENQVNKSAHSELSRSLDAAALQITELREQIDFYEKILRATGDTDGVKIQDLAVRRIGPDDTFRYDLILVNTAGHSSPVNARIRMELEGMQDGQLTVLPVAVPDAGESALELRFYRTVRGNFRLPAAFAPNRIRIQVVPEGQTTAVTERWFGWNPSIG